MAPTGSASIANRLSAVAVRRRHQSARNLPHCGLENRMDLRLGAARANALTSRHSQAARGELLEVGYVGGGD